jgi:hypothetical protein
MYGLDFERSALEELRQMLDAPVAIALARVSRSLGETGRKLCRESGFGVNGSVRRLAAPAAG